MWEELKNLREGVGLSQVDLGSESGISGSSICAWENQMPRQIVHLIDLCKVLGTSPNALLGWSVESPAPSKKEISAGSLVVYPELNKEQWGTVLSTLKDREKTLRASLSKSGRKIDIELAEELNGLVDILEAFEACPIFSEERSE